jgi:hypothetical protein
MSKILAMAAAIAGLGAATDSETYQINNPYKEIKYTTSGKRRGSGSGYVVYFPNWSQRVKAKRRAANRRKI